MRNNIVHPTITKEDIEQAKALDLLAYMQLYEPSAIKKCGRNEYCLVEHDSLKMSNGFWFWHSRGFGAQSALDFMVKLRGMDFVDAVRLLSNGIPARVVQTPTNLHSNPQANPTKEKPFFLPEAHKNNFRAIAYLQSRGIAKDVIDQCITDGLLYESKKYSNVVFVGKDDANVPRFACVRSIKGNFRQDIEGSSKAYSFSVPSKEATARFLVIAEAPIDILSLMTIHNTDKQSKTDYHYLSLGGTSTVALERCLKDYPAIDHVVLCLDTDLAGQQCTDRVKTLLKTDPTFNNRSITVIVEPSPIGKDYNDYVVAKLQRQREEKTANRQRADYFL